VELFIRASNPVCIYLSSVEDDWNKWQEDESDEETTIPLQLFEESLKPCHDYLYEHECYTDKEEVHLLPFKRNIAHYHTEVHEYMGEVEWESEEEE